MVIQLGYSFFQNYKCSVNLVICSFSHFITLQTVFLFKCKDDEFGLAVK